MFLHVHVSTYRIRDDFVEDVVSVVSLLEVSQDSPDKQRRLLSSKIQEQVVVLAFLEKKKNFNVIFGSVKTPLSCVLL